MLSDLLSAEIFLCKMDSMETDIHLTIPMPLHVMVDDVGWWSGTDGSRFNQPYRTGMTRDHVPEDYEALARLGNKLGMKILAGFVLCEWDRFDILKKVPSATWMGTDWSMSGHRKEEKERAAGIIQDAVENVEIGLHGIGHEFWVNKKMFRAEFHNDQCVMRPRDTIRKHLEYFFKLMDQYELAPSPSCFIPPALKHSFGNGDEGFQKLLNEFGISYVLTLLKKARQFSKPVHSKITWECGVLIWDRGKAIPSWNDIAFDPLFSFNGPILTLHWPNILHHDPGKNFMVVDRWVQFIKSGAHKKGYVLSKNIKACLTQYCYKIFSSIRKTHRGFLIDFSWRENIPRNLLDNSFFLIVEKNIAGNLEIFGAHPVFIPKGQGSFLWEIFPDKGANQIILKIKE